MNNEGKQWNRCVLESHPTKETWCGKVKTSPEDAFVNFGVAEEAFKTGGSKAICDECTAALAKAGRRFGR